MARVIKSGLIQMSIPKSEGDGAIEEIMRAMEEKHIPFIENAGEQGVQILCLHALFPGEQGGWGDRYSAPKHPPNLG